MGTEPLFRLSLVSFFFPSIFLVACVFFFRFHDLHAPAVHTNTNSSTCTRTVLHSRTTVRLILTSLPACCFSIDDGYFSGDRTRSEAPPPIKARRVHLRGPIGIEGNSVEFNCPQTSRSVRGFYNNSAWDKVSGGRGNKMG